MCRADAMRKCHPISFPKACPTSLTRQDLFKRPLNPIDFFADDSDRLLIFRRVCQWSDSIQSAPYLMIPGPNEIEAGAPLLAISVDTAHELSGEPRKYQTKEHFNRNTIGRAVEL